MKIVMTLLVRDEEDIIRENLLFHYEMGVDFVIVTDNKSTDSTREILEEFEHKGKLKYLYEPTDNYSQSTWVTRMARMAAVQYKADWVINNDADEFWFPVERSNLKAAFESVPSSVHVLEASRFDMLLTEEKEQAAAPFYERMVYKDLFPTNAFGQPLPPKVAHRAHPKIEVAMGNHSARWPWPWRSKRKTEGQLEILHFPIRSRVQFEHKIKLGGAAYANNTKLPLHIGHAWRKLYADLEDKGSLDYFLNQRILQESELDELVQQGRVEVDTRLQGILPQLSIR